MQPSEVASTEDVLETPADSCRQAAALRPQMGRPPQTWTCSAGLRQAPPAGSVADTATAADLGGTVAGAGFSAAAGTTSGITVAAGTARPGPGVMDLAFAGCLAGTTFGATVTAVATAAAAPAPAGVTGPGRLGPTAIPDLAIAAPSVSSRDAGSGPGASA